MTSVNVRFFDGLSSQPHAARVQVLDDLLTVTPPVGTGFAPLTVPIEQVRWPERTRHGGRIAHLPQGASLQALDVAAWDDWAAQLGRDESWIVRAQQTWRGVALAFVLLIKLMVLLIAVVICAGLAGFVYLAAKRLIGQGR